MSKEYLPANISLIGQIARGTSISFLLGVSGYIFMFFFRFIAAGHYGPEDLGLFEMTNTILLIIIILSTLGIPAGISRYISIYKHQEKPELLSGYIRFILLGTSIAALSFAITLFLLAGIITRFLDFPPQFEILIQIASLIIPIKTLSQILRKIFIAEKKIFFQTFSESILEKFLLLLLLILCALFSLPILFVVISLLIATAISLLFDIYIFTKRIHLPKKKQPLYLHREWILFSLPLLLSGFFTFFIQWSDNILVGKLMNASLLGVYALAYSLGDFVGFLQMPFLAIFTPLTSEKYALREQDSIGMLFTKVTSWLFMLGLVFVALFVVIGKDFFSTFFGSAFTAGYAPLIIISTGLLLYNIFSISETLLILHKKIRFIFSINLITALLNIVLNILCIHLWGILGAALASAIAINIKGLVTFIYASKNETLLLPYNTLIKSLLSIGVAMLIGYTLKGLSGNPIWVLIIIPGLITSIYVSGLLASHSITKEDRGLLILFIRRLKNRIFIT